MAADGVSQRSATPKRYIPKDQNIYETVVQRRLVKELMVAPETNILDYANDEYDQEYYEDDDYPDEVVMLR